MYNTDTKTVCVNCSKVLTFDDKQLLKCNAQKWGMVLGDISPLCVRCLHFKELHQTSTYHLEN